MPGPQGRVPLLGEVPKADIAQDVETGAGVLSSFDPGVNFVSALASDVVGTVSTDRHRFILGTTRPGALVARGTDEPCGPATEPCGPIDATPSQAENGFAASLSARALSEVARFNGLPLLRAAAVDFFEGLQGQETTVTADLCGDGPIPMPVERPPSRAVSCAFLPLAPSSPNSPPFLAAIPDEFEVGITKFLDLDLTASDANGDPVQFTVRGEVPPGLAPGVSEMGHRPKFAWGAGCDQLGAEYTIEIVASDGDLETSRSTTIRVVDADTNLSETFDINLVEYDADQFRSSRVPDGRRASPSRL